MRRKHEFTLIIEGPDVQTDEAMDALFEAGCNDGSFGSCGGMQMADFCRKAASFDEAVASATAAIEGAVPGARVVRVERDLAGIR